jgi:hypothetical protein
MNAPAVLRAGAGPYENGFVFEEDTSRSKKYYKDATIMRIGGEIPGTLPGGRSTSREAAQSVEGTVPASLTHTIVPIQSEPTRSWGFHGDRAKLALRRARVSERCA